MTISGLLNAKSLRFLTNFDDCSNQTSVTSMSSKFQFEKSSKFGGPANFCFKRKQSMRSMHLSNLNSQFLTSYSILYIQETKQENDMMLCLYLWSNITQLVMIRLRQMQKLSQWATMAIGRTTSKKQLIIRLDCGRDITQTFCYLANYQDQIRRISKPKLIRNIWFNRKNFIPLLINLLSYLSIQPNGILIHIFIQL